VSSISQVGEAMQTILSTRAAALHLLQARHLADFLPPKRPQKRLRKCQMKLDELNRDRIAHVRLRVPPTLSAFAHVGWYPEADVSNPVPTGVLLICFSNAVLRRSQFGLRCLQLRLRILKLLAH
jgi:hypothetical protein